MAAEKEARGVEVETEELQTKDGLLRDITVKLDVDVSDALTGLKAVQREAKMATRAVAELKGENYSMSHSEIERLADYILSNHRHEPGRTGESESAVDVAIRLLTDREVSAIPTADLVEELGRREGVLSHWVPPYVNYNIGIRSESQGGVVDSGQGAARILVVID